MKPIAPRLLPWMALLAAACSSATGEPASGDDDGDDVAGDDDDSEGKDGPDAGVDLFPDGLSCTTYSLCTTYKADPSRVPFPTTTGGTLKDGLYRAVQGTSIPYGLAIHEGKYSLIFENLTVAHGEFEIDGEQPDKILMTQTTNCAPAVFNDDPAFVMHYEEFFSVDGDELITYSGCDSLDPENCGSPTRMVRVDSLCDDLDSLSCDGGDCHCATFDDGEIPDRPAGGTCEF